MIVQIYEVQNCREAKDLVDVGVDHVGILVGKGEYPRELSIDKAREIVSCIRGRAVAVALSLSPRIQDILEITQAVQPDIIHIGTLPEVLTPQDVARIKKQFLGVKVMRSIPVDSMHSLRLAKDFESVADYLLLDTQKKGDTQIGATGETHDWGLSKKIVALANVPVILAGGLGPHNVAEAIAIVRPYGVDSKSKTDRSGGREKDIDTVRAFVQAAKVADF